MTYPKLRTTFDIHRAAFLFQGGWRTDEIAKQLQTSEAAVANSLARLRESYWQQSQKRGKRA